MSSISPPPKVVTKIPLTYFFVNECTTNVALNKVIIYHTNAPVLSHKREDGVVTRSLYRVQKDGLVTWWILPQLRNVSLYICFPFWLTLEPINDSSVSQSTPFVKPLANVSTRGFPLHPLSFFASYIVVYRCAISQHVGTTACLA